MIRLSKSAQKANVLLAGFGRVFWVDSFVLQFKKIVQLLN